MKSKLQTGKVRIYIMLAMFVIVLMFVGILMKFKLESLMHNYVEKQVAEQVKVLAELFEENLNSELLDLENLAVFIENKTAPIETLLEIERLSDEDAVWGVLELGGNALYGEKLSVADFSGIQVSFRGSKSISYKQGEGLLFTVPVYNSGNVKYVLYKFIREEQLADKFNITFYGGNGKFLVVTRDDQLMISYAGWDANEEAFFLKEEVREVFSVIGDKMNIATAASGHCKDDNNSQYLFMAELENYEFRLVGFVPEEVASEGLFYVSTLILWVFGLLLVLLAIGMAFLFGAEEKVQESEALRQAKLLADAANKAKTDFLASMSHEIRTPINAVMGMNEMILRECKDENIKMYAVKIQSASKTLLSLINDILDLSKIEAGKMEIIESNYHLSSALNNVVNMIRVKAEQKKLDFYVEVDEKLPDELFGDEVRLRQVIINILNNAVKYTSRGSVRLKVEREMYTDTAVVLKISVKDTGIGIRKEDTKKLFSEFERLEQKKNRNIEGTGLGLAITARLVKLMKGHIEVESVYGQGSTFTVYLPQKKVGEGCIGEFEEKYRAYVQSMNTYKESFTAPSARILVVDDTEMNQLVVVNFLKRTQVQITCCSSGEECLQLVRENQYDVILLDHMMPGMDGIEVIRELKKMPDNQSKDAAIIALTANAIVGVREMYLAEGFDYYLSKPVDGNELETIMRKYIPKDKLSHTKAAESPSSEGEHKSVAVKADNVERKEGKASVEQEEKEESKLKKMIGLMFPEELEIQYKLLNLILSAAFVGGILSLLLSIGLGLDYVAITMIVMIIALVGFSLWLANIKKKPRMAALLIVIGANLIIFPIMYFTCGGINSGMPVWLVLGMIFSWLILTGRTCFIMYTLNALMVVGCILLEMIYPDLVTPLASRNAFHGDMIQSILIVTCIFGAIFKYQTHVYENQKKELVKANNAKSEFLANMSHEIRTPINAILGYNELIMKETRESQTGVYAMNVQTAGSSLLSMVDELLQLTGMDAEVIELLKQYNLPTDSVEKEFKAPNARILVVDDNPMNLDLIRGMLKDTHVQIDCGENGEEAVALVKKNTYNLVFMDHMMPIMDGLEALQKMRGEHLCDDTPIIVLTANVINNAQQQYLKDGFSDYLSKPVFREQIIAMLQKYLPEELYIEKQEDFLSSLSFLDTNLGMQYCFDNEDFYKEMLGAYCSTNKYREINKNYQEENWDKYRILVHALKSTSLSIGAATLSEEAKQLEMAAKEERIEYIKEKHSIFMEQYKCMLDSISMALKGSERTVDDVKEVPAERRQPVQSLQEHILIVDDDEMNLKMAAGLLEKEYKVDCVSSGDAALEFLKKQIPHLILLDLHMPRMNGFDVIKEIKKDGELQDIPIIFLTADNDRDTEVKGFREGALDFIAKPFVTDIMMQRIKRILELNRLQKNLQEEVEKQTQTAEARRAKVERLSLQIMLTLAETIDAKDKYTNGHSIRVAEYARDIAKRLGKSEQEQEDIYYIGLLHDIGKIGIPDSIINKDSQLTDEEYAVIKAHPTIGADILENMTEIPGLSIGAHWHHETYDGKGYPDGLSGEEIPEIARIIGVADAYDAMTSKRSYRDILPQSVAREELVKGKGIQFDSQIADVMIAMIDEDHQYQMHG